MQPEGGAKPWSGRLHLWLCAQAAVGLKFSVLLSGRLQPSTAMGMLLGGAKITLHLFLQIGKRINSDSYRNAPDRFLWLVQTCRCATVFAV